MKWRSMLGCLPGIQPKDKMKGESEKISRKGSSSRNLRTSSGRSGGYHGVVGAEGSHHGSVNNDAGMAAAVAMTATAAHVSSMEGSAGCGSSHGGGGGDGC
ncbi:hypothetical protein HS088_TW07G00140 [Tripterygium wilfordii]|uniref:Uncharacterized protein n=1 Tax=Tripterygium wilfordii TaxID=458696 RepID=A0A7J7DER5_TRIWF|nr:hypothetical protein HS088_TW07G00140 [Tripterygium wilfordii]